MTDNEVHSYILLFFLAWFCFEILAPKKRLLQLSPETRYLGLPAGLDHPCEGVFVHCGKVVDNCVRISAIQRVPRAEYEEDLWRGRILFSEDREGLLLYATELCEDGCKLPETQNRAVHLIRKAYIR